MASPIPTEPAIPTERGRSRPSAEAGTVPPATPTDVERAEPEPVAAARALAERLNFPNSCSGPVGRLLATLAAAARGTVAESGTGCGFGAAWLRAGLPEGGRLVTVERDPDRAAAVAGMFDGDPAVTVLAGGWPPRFQGEPDALRVDWLTDSRFHAVELLASPTESVIIATRR